jgi:hypothetical protein
VYRKRECAECHHWISTEEWLTDHRFTQTDARVLTAYRDMSKKDRMVVWAVITALTDKRIRRHRKGNTNEQ